MKKFTLLICLLIMVAIPTVAFSASPTPTDGESGISDQIDNLKDRIASRVAQLNLVEKRGIIATVSEVSGTKITVTDTSGQSRFVDVDEITKFSSPSAKTSFGISDLTQGTRISVLGLYNKDSRRILARFVDTYTIPLFVSGLVATIDRENFTFLVTSENNRSILVDVENTTRTSSYTREDDIARSGFSQLAVGERVHVVGFPNRTEQNRMTAGRILTFPELTSNPNVNLSPQQSPTPAQ